MADLTFGEPLHMLDNSEYGMSVIMKLLESQDT